MPQPSLRPQDVVVLAKLLTVEGSRPPIARIAVELSISASEIHAGLKRLEQAGLVVSDSTGSRPVLDAAAEFLVHAVKYAFPAKRGGVTRGVPTSYAASPLSSKIVAGELPPVWPHPEGAIRGASIEPLYRSVPSAALRDPALHEMLALIDALREGRARERKLAEVEILARIHRWTDVRPKSAAARKRR